MSDRHWSSLGEVAADIASGAVSSVEVTRAQLERIERLDPELKSFAAVGAEAALEAAARADRELSADGPRGPLHGVPLAVKDLCDTVGLPTEVGMPALKGRRPQRDAAVVERLEAAGAVLLGKLQMTEGASGEHHPDIDPPRNPWNREFSPGGSSSGSGVAVAAGLCFGALGSDTAGSIRFPSSFCGVAGLKPTWGRVSRRGIFPLSASLDTVGPMTRRVADAALMLGVIAGHDPGDPTSAWEPVSDFMGALASDVHGMRIGIDRAYTGGAQPELCAAVEEAAGVFGSLGALVREVELPGLESALDALGPIFHAEVARAHAELFPDERERYGPHLRGLIEIGQEVTGTAYAEAHEARLEFRGRLHGLFEQIDLLLCPATVTPALPAEMLRSLPSDFRLLRDLLRYTGPYNVSGSPTLTVRCGFNETGLPLALQLVGRDFGEALLLRAGHAYEEATYWHLRRPPDLD